MRVLVTGGAGYVGSVASSQLLRRGHEVRVLDSLLYGGEALLSLYPEEGFSFLAGDVRDSEAIARALEGIDAVVHLAAIVGDPACRTDPALASEVNLDASLRLFEASGGHGVARFVFASTCSNYGKMSDGLEYVDEDSELRPISLYAETKVAVEQRLLASPAADSPAATVLRFATIFGLSPRARFDLTVNEFTAELALNRKLVVYGEQFWRPYVHVRDAARAIVMTLEAERDLVAGQVFNVGSTAENYRKQDLLELIRLEVGDDVVVERVHVDEDPRDYRVSFDRIRDRLGFQPTRTVPDGVREVLQAVTGGVVADFADSRHRN